MSHLKQCQMNLLVDVFIFLLRIYAYLLTFHAEIL